MRCSSKALLHRCDHVMHCCMRTTVDLDDQLLSAARKLAAEEGTTLTSVIERALAALLAPRPPATPRFRLKWTVRKGRAAPPVDIADRDALYDAMEGRR